LAKAPVSKTGDSRFEPWVPRFPTTRKNMRTALAAALCALVAPAAGQAWRPHVHAAAAYAQHRNGTIAFAVRTPGHKWGFRGRRTFPSASVLKAMLLVAYLNGPSVRGRPLRAGERALLGPMIRRSDNDAASAIFVRVGTHRLRVLARHAGMRRFTPVAPVWGISRIDAADQARFFLRIDTMLPPRHRAYAMRLLESVTPSQRWGVGQVRPRGWRLFFKGGWGSGTGWVDHQVALLTKGDRRVSLAILTYADGSHAYGKETLRGIAKRLLRGL
jgi:beta-lactamase family protein